MTDKIEPATDGEIASIRTECEHQNPIYNANGMLRVISRIGAEKKRADELQAHIDAGIGDCFQEATDAIRKSSEAFQRRRAIWEMVCASMGGAMADSSTIDVNVPKMVSFAIKAHAEFTRQMEAEHEAD